MPGEVSGIDQRGFRSIISNGWKKQTIEKLRAIRLSEGVPTFEGTPSQISTKNLVSQFDAKDYNLMSRFSSPGRS